MEPRIEANAIAAALHKIEEAIASTVDRLTRSSDPSYVAHACDALLHLDAAYHLLTDYRKAQEQQ